MILTLDTTPLSLQTQGDRKVPLGFTSQKEAGKSAHVLLMEVLHV